MILEGGGVEMFYFSAMAFRSTPGNESSMEPLFVGAIRYDDPNGPTWEGKRPVLIETAWSCERSSEFSLEFQMELWRMTSIRVG